VKPSYFYAPVDFHCGSEYPKREVRFFACLSESPVTAVMGDSKRQGVTPKKHMSSLKPLRGLYRFRLHPFFRLCGHTRLQKSPF
jgi:hypothetical protein